MTPTLTYLLEVLICSGLFISLYMLAFHKKVQYRICRFYLMATMTLSVIIPAMNVPLYKGEPVEMLDGIQVNITRSNNNAMETTPSVATTENVEEPKTESVQPTTAQTAPILKNVDWSLAVYWAIVAVMMIVIAKGLFSILKIRRKAVSRKLHDCHIVESESIGTPFTFLRTIYIGTDYSDTERQQILSHELSHARHYHSVEKLAMSLLRALFWFNPFIWIAEKRLEEVQEWQADSEAINEGYEISEYQQTIFKQIFGCSPELASGMSNSFTKNRFIMMTKKLNGKIGVATFFFTIAIALSAFLVFGCTTNITPDEKSTNNGNCYIAFEVDHFFDKNENTAKRYRFVENQKYTQHALLNYKSVEVYDFNNNTKAPVMVVSNGTKIAYDKNATALKWVNRHTKIFKDNKRISYFQYKRLRQNDYACLYYVEGFEDLSFVYVCTHGEVIENVWRMPLKIDTLGYEMPNTFEASGFGLEELHGYKRDWWQTYSNSSIEDKQRLSDNLENIAETSIYYYVTPGLEIFFNGNHIDRDILNTIGFSSTYSNVLYRNEDAQHRFGNQYNCVLEYMGYLSLKTEVDIKNNNGKPLFSGYKDGKIHNGTDFFKQNTDGNQYTFEDLKKQIDLCNEIGAKENVKTIVTIKIDDESLIDISEQIKDSLNAVYGDNLLINIDERYNMK